MSGCASPESIVVANGEAKKLRLFGFELGPCIQDGEKSSDSLQREQSEKCSARGMEDKKYGCRFCLKEFANSQALGGHQNAHKKERMKKKRIEIQARKAGIGYYLHPLIKCHGSEYARSAPWCCVPSRSVPAFMLFEESHGSFKPLDRNMYASGFVASKSSVLPSRLPVQQSTGMFSMTMQPEGLREDRPVIVKPSPLFSIPKQSCKSLDLQLGISVQTNARNGV